MQFKVLISLAVIGFVSAQRGHYAGSSGPILGQRYQNLAASNPQPSSNSIQQQAAPAQPAQSNFVAPSRPINNRFEGPSNNHIYQQPQQLGPFGFGSYPFIGPYNSHNHGNFNNGFNGYYGRR